MRVVVPIKYVPDIQSDRRLAPDGAVVREAADGTLNELDENAIETALRVVEALPADEQERSEVVVVTVGPPDADLAIRKAYQLGAHRGVRLTDPAIAHSDYFGTAVALAAVIRHSVPDADIVITGLAALDGLGSVVPSLLAAELDWPQLLVANRLSVHDGIVEITRELDGVTEELCAALPAVVSVTDHISTPRYPNFSSIMAARTQAIEVIDLAAVGLSADQVGARAARTSVISASRRPPRPAEVIVDDGTAGEALAQYLISHGLV